MPTFRCAKRSAHRRDTQRCVLGAARGALSEGDCRHLPGTGAAAGDRLPQAGTASSPLAYAGRRMRNRYVGFISSSNGEEVFWQSCEHGLRKKYCRAPALGCWKATETPSHALQYLSCIRRDQATEEVTEEPCHRRFHLWAGGSALRLAPSGPGRETASRQGS